jgi:hypothetical protein
VINLSSQSALLLELYPNYQPFINNGKIVVKLIRALSGCIESALLWYEAISSFLMSMGFDQSIHDKCLFIKGIGKDAIHIAVYVDDLFISALKRADIKIIESEMKQRFSDITFNYGLHHEYLGAHLDFSTPNPNPNPNPIPQLLCLHDDLCSRFFYFLCKHIQF